MTNQPTDPTPWIPASPEARPSPPAPRTARGSTRFAVGVAAASLVLGGSAGVAGAAGWRAWSEPLGDSTSSTPSTAAQVASTSEVTDGSVEQVAATVLPSVVRIDVTTGRGAGSGSGVILSEDGEILTNAHVVAGAENGGRLRVSFDDGSTASATLVGTDPLTDTAVIRAEDVSGLTPITLGTSADLRVGQDVVAIGSPFGLDATVTSGIVSALDRPVNVGADDRGNSTTYPAIQTDAAINPGNSGGPLVDSAGHLVGINSSIRTSSSASAEAGSIGLGFAIPIDEVLPIIEQIRAGEEPTHARLGISVADAALAERDAEYGALVRDVAASSTAEEAGLVDGDVIVRVEDRRIGDADALVATIRSYRPGDTVTLTWSRDGDEQQAEVELGSD